MQVTHGSALRSALVASHLKKHGIDVVLSGGTCVTLHSNGLYVSHDLDFVDNGFTPRRQLKRALAEIGFAEAGRTFKHCEVSFLIDFPAPPLAVGREPPKEIVTLRFSSGELRALSPTDCVKDRLAAYYYWRDRQALEQAVLVAQHNPIDVAEVRRWSEREGKLAEFEHVACRLIAWPAEKQPPRTEPLA